MKLVSAHVQGCGRITNSKINLDAKVIAIVGPNEAGKTTLLRALAHVNSGEDLPSKLRSRTGVLSKDEEVTRFEYIMEPSDLEVLQGLDLHELPKRATIGRAATQSVPRVGLTPNPIKSVAPLTKAVAVLRHNHEDPKLENLVDPDTVYGDAQSDGARDFRAELGAVIEDVSLAISEPGRKLAAETRERAASLQSATLVDQGSLLDSALGMIVHWYDREDPAQAAREIAWRRSPEFRLFGEDDRTILSAYNLDSALVDTTPAALANLAATASLDLNGLLDAIREDDVSRRRTAIVQANKRMDAIFSEAWKQSRLAVHFNVDGDQLRIELMEDGERVTVFDERSAGLRMFAAIVAFLRAHGGSRPTILLIDEAENHLHVDAQADLVNTFESQEQALKVIYTTHSPACLPSDLGTGIRSVVPSAASPQVSEIRNSFWEGAAGYSPLLLAMGAGAAAFTPARRVVLAEGATEMIILPSLLRAATGEDDIPYQIAPGLAEVPGDFLSRLDLEASRVAYLVDKDRGGESLREALIRAEVPEDLVVDASVPGVENLIDASCYLAAFKQLLGECNSTLAGGDLPELPPLPGMAARSWAAEVESWVKKQGLKAPSKVAVANWLVQNSQALPSAEGAELLRDLHYRLRVALGVPSGPGVDAT